MTVIMMMIILINTHHWKNDDENKTLRSGDCNLCLKQLVTDKSKLVGLLTGKLQTGNVLNCKQITTVTMH